MRKWKGVAGTRRGFRRGVRGVSSVREARDRLLASSSTLLLVFSVDAFVELDEVAWFEDVAAGVDETMEMIRGFSPPTLPPPPRTDRRFMMI